MILDYDFKGRLIVWSFKKLVNERSQQIIHDRATGQSLLYRFSMGNLPNSVAAILRGYYCVEKNFLFKDTQ